MKKMAKIYMALAAIATLAFGLFSCSGGGNDVNPLALYTPQLNIIPVLKYLDLSNAKSLYISGGSGTSANISASANGSSAKKIFKITDTGHVEEVKYLDANKKEITITAQPVAIEKINDEYIFVGFGINMLNISSGYLVRKSDGAVFDMKNAGMPRDTDGKKIFYTDKKNNVYFLSNHNTTESGWGYFIEIVKINLENIETLSSQVVSASTDNVSNFDVDANGNLIYSCNLKSDRSQYFTRIRKHNGGLKNVSYDKYWIGLDGCIYCRNSPCSSIIKKISIDAEGNVSESDYGTNTEINFNSSYKLVLKNRILMVIRSDHGYGEQYYVFEVYNPTSNPRVFTLSGLTLNSITAVNSTENFYYIAGTDNSSNTILIKVNPEDDSWTNLLPDNNYEVYTFTASETDGITFNALRMSDGKKIIGKVGINGGAVTVIDEESNAQISYLERIN